MSTWVTALVVGRGPVPAHQGRAVQVDPFKPTLKAPGTKRLKLKHDKLVSSFAFIFNLRRYIKAQKGMQLPEANIMGRGLHSSTFQLNLSRF